MMKELQGYAEAASFKDPRRARGALEDFVASAKMANGNGTERLKAAELFHGQVRESDVLGPCFMVFDGGTWCF